MNSTWLVLVLLVFGACAFVVATLYELGRLSMRATFWAVIGICFLLVPAVGFTVMWGDPLMVVLRTVGLALIVGMAGALPSIVLWGYLDAGDPAAVFRSAFKRGSKTGQ